MKATVNYFGKAGIKMRKRFKSIFALALAGVLVFGSTNKVNAASQNLTLDAEGKYTSSSSLTSTFTVDDSLLGGDIVLVVPDDANPTLDGVNHEFKFSGEVSAYGTIPSSKKLTVSTPTSIKYASLQNFAEVYGDVALNNGSNAEWSAQQLKDGKNDSSQIISYPLTVRVKTASILYMSKYTSKIVISSQIVNA